MVKIEGEREGERERKVPSAANGGFDGVAMGVVFTRVGIFFKDEGSSRGGAFKGGVLRLFILINMTWSVIF